MHDEAGAARVLRLLARKLEEYLDGDEMALETLAEALEEADVTPDDVQMVVLGLRGLASSAVAGREPVETASLPLPREIQRVLSAEERGVLTTEAWGYLLDLRASGALDAHQLERVLEALTNYEERPVELARARDVAARVALEPQDGTIPGDYPHGDQEVAH
ncbi:MAG TPA: DUF494 family protein [Verrucomicrobiae bacterium]|nr:DUF494 family protein [Verrucomicrobiae bacterium]